MLVVQPRCPFGGNCRVSWDEVRPLRHGIHYNHDRIEAVRVRKFHDEVHADPFPSSFRWADRVEFPNRTTTDYLVPETFLARPGEGPNVSPDLRPPIVPGDQLQRLHASRVPSDPGVVVLRNNPLAKILRVRNVNPAVERQQPIRLIPLRLVHLSRRFCSPESLRSRPQWVPQWFLPLPCTLGCRAGCQLPVLVRAWREGRGFGTRTGQGEQPPCYPLVRVRGPLDERVRPVRPLRIPGGDGGSSRSGKGKGTIALASG